MGNRPCCSHSRSTSTLWLKRRGILATRTDDFSFFSQQPPPFFHLQPSVEELRRRRCPSEHSGHATTLRPKSAPTNLGCDDYGSSSVAGRRLQERHRGSGAAPPDPLQDLGRLHTTRSTSPAHRKSADASGALRRLSSHRAAQSLQAPSSPCFFRSLCRHAQPQ
jgi:hypothetical protein